MDGSASSTNKASQIRARAHIGGGASFKSAFTLRERVGTHCRTLSKGRPSLSRSPSCMSDVMDVVKNSLCGGNRPTEIGARLSVEASAVSFELEYSDIQAIRVERPVPTCYGTVSHSSIRTNSL